MNTRHVLTWRRVVMTVLLVLPLLALPLASAAPVQALPSRPANIEAGLLDQMAAEGQATFWVLFHQQASLQSADAPTEWEARGQFVVEQLQATAKTSQAGLRHWLEARSVRYEPFWLVNAIKLTGDGTLLKEVAARPEVAQIIADGAFQIPEPRPSEEQARLQAVEWNIERIGAPQVWSAFGVQGEGIVVANIDTGVQFDHPALAGQYRGLLPGGGVDHNYQWFDPAEVCPSQTPCDNVGHGTHTMGTMVGGDSTGQNRIGVAPAARWIAAKGCENMLCTFTSLVASGQWILAPTDLNGETPRPDLRPHVVNNSWGGGPNPFYQGIVQAWVAAGIFPVFSNGNFGPGCSTVGSPADYAESYGVGAFDINNQIAPFSSRGPSLSGAVKPNISAPGVGVRSSVPGNGYQSADGTSMAAPHVAGSVALIWSAAPSLVGNIDATRALLDQTAVDVTDLSCGGSAAGLPSVPDVALTGGGGTPTLVPTGTFPPPQTPTPVSTLPPSPGENNVWGQGRLDVFAAVDQAPRAPTGELAGVVADSATSLPIAGAVLRVTGPAARTTFSDPAGHYTLRLMAGTYTLSAEAFGYLSQTLEGIEVLEGATTPRDVALTLAPAHAVSGHVRNGAGQPLAEVEVSLVGVPIAPVTTDASGAYSFGQVPEGSYQVQAQSGQCYEPGVQPLVVDGAETLDFTLTLRLDGYGYFCEVVPFDYIEAGTELPIGDQLASVDLPFPFTLYGKTYQQVQVTAPGYLAFQRQFPFFFNQPIPSVFQPNAAIYAFWDDLFADSQTSVRTQVVGSAPHRQFVVEWRDVGVRQEVDRLDFEVVLFETGVILVQYKDLGESARGRGASATVGLENHDGSIGFQYSHDQAVLRSQMAIRYRIPEAGFVRGVITNANDSRGVSGATVRALKNGVVVREDITTPGGEYQLQVPLGTYTVEVVARNYAPQTFTVTLDQENETEQRNIALRTANAEVDLTAIEVAVVTGQSRTRVVTLRNTGTEPMTWRLGESGGGPVRTTSTQSLVRNPNADPNAHTTRELFAGLQPGGWAATLPGNVLRSWTPAGVQVPGGVGYTGKIWLSDLVSFPTRNTEFEFDAPPTGRSWVTSWTDFSSFGADMAYDTARDLMCQLKVGPQNGIYCWDPDTGVVKASITGDFPWTATSQRGLAYRPDDDSFYVGGWNSGVIFHIKGLSAPDRGTVTGLCFPADTNISGLAWNPGSRTLWMATNSPTDTLYQLNPETCDVLSTLAHPRPGFNGQGLELDEDGNLWMVSQFPPAVYLVESGVPAFVDVPWLSASATSGTLAPGQSKTITLTVNTTGLSVGTYNAQLFVQSNSGRRPSLRIPVSLLVSRYRQGVNSGGPAYTDRAGDPWAKDQKYTTGGWGYLFSSKIVDTRSAIAGTLDDPLYQTARVGGDEYRFDALPEGVYQVELRFAEIQGKRPFQRLYDVIVEGGLVLPAHDIAAEVGRLAADEHTFFVSISDGQLSIRFIPRSGFGQPLINAIRLTHRPDR